MRQHTSYRREGDHHLIEINLREARQLFNSLDPAPFHDKDLDTAAEAYIVEAVQELSTRRRNKLVLYLQTMDDSDTRTIPAAIHNYFGYRARQAGSDLRLLLRFGLISLLIGLLFMGACLMLRQLLTQYATSQLITEGLLIVGWVALWRPLEVFLYEWWPIRQRQRRYQHLATMPVEVRRPANIAANN
jgi:hypothetical protein